MAIERISYLTGEKETACVIKNVGFAFLDHAQGNKLYLQLGPDKSDWTGQERNFNMVTIAIDILDRNCGSTCRRMVFVIV